MSVVTKEPEKQRPANAPPRRWWRRKLVWILGLPLTIVFIAGAIMTWGAMQPRPEGYAVAGAPAAPQQVPEDLVPIEEPVAEPTLHTLDARDLESFVLFDFDSGVVVEGDLTSTGWDVAFRRTKLLTNSGATNPDGTGGALDLGEVPIEEVVIPAAPTFVVDSLGGEDGDDLLNEAAGRWYSYSFITHIVSVKPNTYLIRTDGPANALVQFESYYCADEEPGCITFRYLMVPADGS